MAGSAHWVEWQESPAAVDLAEAFGRIADMVSVKAGEVLFRRARAASFVYVVRKGRVALVWADQNGVHPLDVAGPGRIIGLAAALNGTHSMMARAVEDCELICIPVHEVVQMLRSDPLLHRAATRLLAQELARKRAMASNRCKTGTPGKM